MDTVARWHAEHGNFGRLLDFLEAQHSLMHGGQRPSYELVLDVVSYLKHFPDRYHCSRENIAFDFLVLSDPGMRAKTERLVQDHLDINIMGEKLHAMLLRPRRGDAASAPQIEVALAAYLACYRRHIALEEEEILPRAAELLTPEQWEAVDHAAPAGPEPFRSYHPRRHNPTFGSEAEIRYHELIRRISVWRSTQPDDLPAACFESAPTGIRDIERKSADIRMPVRREDSAGVRTRAWRLLARQAAMLFALVVSFLQYYFFDVELRILRLPSLIVYVFR